MAAEFEAKIEVETEKAVLVEMTLGGMYWLPKSAIFYRSEPDFDNNVMFSVKDWWWRKKEEVQPNG